MPIKQSISSFDSISPNADPALMEKLNLAAFGVAPTKELFMAQIGNFLPAPAYLVAGELNYLETSERRAFISFTYAWAGPAPKNSKVISSDYEKRIFGPKLPKMIIREKYDQKTVKRGHQLWGYGSIGFSTKSARDRTAYHIYLRIRSDLHGSGIASRFVHNHAAMVGRFGFHQIELTATEAGQYFWATVGYDFLRNRDRTLVKEQLARFADHFIPPAKKQAYLKAIRKLQSAAEIARFKFENFTAPIEDSNREVTECHAGKWALLTGEPWRAYRKLG